MAALAGGANEATAVAPSADADAEYGVGLVADDGRAVLDGARFDASQYAFFGGGNDGMEEVELGGLEDDEEEVALSGLSDDHYQMTLRMETEGSLSDIDDLSSTFSKLKGAVEEHMGTSYGASFSRESSLTGEWALDPESSYWLDRHAVKGEHALASQPQTTAAQLASLRLHRTSSYPQQESQGDTSQSVLGFGPLYRTSSHPQQEPQFGNPSEPVSIPRPSFPSYPPSQVLSHGSPSRSHHMNVLPAGAGLHVPPSSSNVSPYGQFSLPGMPRQPLPFGNSLPQLGPGFSLTNRQQNPLSSHSPSGTVHMHNLMQHQLPPPSGGGMLPPQMLSHHQHAMLQGRPSLPHFSRFPQMPGHQFPPQGMNRYDPVLGISDFGDPRFLNMMHRGRPGPYFMSEGPDFRGNGWGRFRSKYMTFEEIENISRMQHAATHGSDPYIDDYYHQACVAKKKLIEGLRHHFCPHLIRDPSSRARAKDEPHAYLQVEALGRLPFSSIRRPRPLLDVEQISAAGDDHKPSMKSLEQEPMLAARITIEDALCLLLDVDDVDRVLQFNKPQDGGLQLRTRRQALMEEVANSFQLVDPLGQAKPGLAAKDDLVFLRIVSLPKGRKLLARYLHLLMPGSELARVVCMAIFRHLRFIFGNLPQEPFAAETTQNLAKAVSAFVYGMELAALSACLAAVVCSSEQPPLRPLGYAVGDGASVAVKSVLDRATELLIDNHVASNYSIPNRTLWQASFDAFFQLLTKYCMSKFDSLVQSLHTQGPAAAGAAAISREMPVELLRSSLPHTNEQQRRILLDFAQRTVPVSDHSSHGGGSDAIPSESVPS